MNLTLGRYDITERTVRKPLLDRHPEDRFDDGLPRDLYEIAAQRLGYTMAYLESLLEDGEGNKDTPVFRDTSLIPSIKQRVENKFPLPITAPTPSKLQDSSLTNEQAAELLQKQIILEHHHNWDDRAPNFQRLWAFASTVENSKQFFALDRWPPELQTQERRNEIWQSGPAIPSPERTSEQDFPRPKENEIFYPGETFFPFGETPYHEALLARQIDQNRPDGMFTPLSPFSSSKNKLANHSPPLLAPIRRPPYSDPFALPELPETETPALMDYAAGLGLGKRKRPVVEDDTSSANFHGDKTVFITAATTPGGATSVPITTTEAIATSSYPTPEFSPETIGGVEMQVTESPAVRVRRQVRFNAPGGSGYGGGAGLESSEGSSAVKRGVRPTTELGWFGPKLGAKPGRNRDGGGDEDSAGTGTTSSGSASGGGQGWVKRPKTLSSKSRTRSTE